MRIATIALTATLVLATSLAAQLKVQQQNVVNGALVPAPQIPIDQARRIGRLEAIELVKKGQAVFVDVRSKETYDKNHIKGALSMPQSKLPELITSIPPNKMLITYCACVEEHTAALAVLYFNAHNIKNTAALKGGWKEWIAAKLPVEGLDIDAIRGMTR